MEPQLIVPEGGSQVSELKKHTLNIVTLAFHYVAKVLRSANLDSEDYNRDFYYKSITSMIYNLWIICNACTFLLHVCLISDRDQQNIVFSENQLFAKDYSN